MLDTTNDNNGLGSMDLRMISMSRNVKDIYKKPHDVRVITFNILSHNFVSDEYYPKVEKRYINFKTRVEKVKKLLLSWMKVNFIICLQEISMQWYEEIGDLFVSNEYDF